MIVEKETRLGTIKLNEVIFEKAIEDAVARTEGRVMLATEKGRIANAVMPPEIIFRDDEDAYHIEFYTITEFGSSIKELSTIVLDNLENELKELQPNKNQRMVMRVVGVKSRQIAERDIEIERLYEVNR